MLGTEGTLGKHLLKAWEMGQGFIYLLVGRVMSEVRGREWLEDMFFHEEHTDYRCKLFPTFAHPTQPACAQFLEAPDEREDRWVDQVHRTVGSWSALGVPLCECKR